MATRSRPTHRLYLQSVARITYRAYVMSYDIGGNVLEWFTSYLSGRIQSVRCGMSSVHFRRLSRLVWSAAGIGPRTDTIPALHSGPTAARWASQPAATHVRRRSMASAVQQQETVSACSDHVAALMQSNRLQLNTTKTEVIWRASNRRQHQLPHVALRVGTDMSHQLPR